MRFARAVAVTFVLVVAAAAACTGSDTAGSAGDDEASPATTTTAPAPVWEQVVPGGDCQCADGSEYSFWVREADPERVVLFFQGGGACFSAESCSFTDGTYKVTTGVVDDPSARDGIFDVENEENPFADHSFVYVPYCTGDVHIGDATTEYAPDLTVQHKGFVNGSAALDHLLATFPDAAEVFVTGESAGAIPTPLFAGLVSDHLPDADIAVLADGSGAYPDVPGINTTIGTLWGTQAAVPDWPETEGVAPEDWSIPGLFVHAGLHAPDIVFARHDYAFDEAQVFYAGLAGIPGSELVTLIDANETQIEAEGVDLLSYIAGGSQHTVLGQERFYTEEVEGVPLLDWVTRLAEGEEVDDVHCTECANS
jgi:hypothetical protein